MVRCIVCLLSLIPSLVLAQTSDKAQKPLVVGRAELQTALRTGAPNPGNTVLLRTVGEWQEGDCKIPANKILTGQLMPAATAPAAKSHAVLGLRMNPILCTGRSEARVLPLIVALDATPPPVNEDLRRMDNYALQRSAIVQSFTPMSQGARPTVGPSSQGGAFAGAALASTLGQLSQPEPQKQERLQTGEIRGLRRLFLELPGHDGVTRFVSPHEISLNKGWQFVMAYAPAPEIRVARQGVMAPASSLAPAKEEIEEVCVPGGCQQLAAGPIEASSAAAWKISLRALGYEPRLQRAIVGLENGASIHFIGSDQLLLTFFTHPLMQRPHETGPWEGKPRSVRAVLIARSDGKILRVKNWTVPDDLGPIAWSTASGRVLARIGSDLVSFGPNMTVNQRFHLPGPLLFLSSTPGGERFLAATLHEKHSAEEHDQMQAASGFGMLMDEEFDLTGLSDTLQAIGTQRVAVEPSQPALVRSGMISARPLHHQDWVLEESDWDGASRSLAHLRSACDIDTVSLSNEVLLIQGCSLHNEDETWFRVINSKGATILNGVSPYGEFLQEVESDRTGELLALATSHFDHPVNRRSRMRASEYSDLAVAVYSSRTGKPFFRTQLHEGSAQEHTFALAPDGADLAVLTSGALQQFHLSPQASK